MNIHVLYGVLIALNKNVTYLDTFELIIDMTWYIVKCSTPVKQINKYESVFPLVYWDLATYNLQ